MTSSYGRGFRVTDELPPQWASDRGNDIFFDVTLNTELNIKSNCQWFEKQWQSCGVIVMFGI